MPSNGRIYRTRLEVLRDILGIAGEEANKSRIIRLANLNPASFDRYVAFCLENGLLELEDSHYHKTGVSGPAIEAINHVLTKAEELGFAIRDLEAMIGRENPEPAPEAPALRFASAAAWSDLTRSGARRNGFPLDPAAPRWAPHVVTVTVESPSNPSRAAKESSTHPPLPELLREDQRSTGRASRSRGK
jgi:predicted transcriptional regulator